MIECNAAILLARGGPLELQRITLGEPRADEIVVKMTASGICRSQLSHIQQPETDLPLLLGHEGVGEVAEVGSAVTRFRVGDTAVITWTSHEPSERERNLQLPNVTLRGTPLNVQHVFTWSEYAVVSQSQAVRVASDSAPASFLATLGCALNTAGGALLRTAAAQPSDTLAVLGTGGVGLAAIFIAREHGLSTIVAVDINESQLELARQLGATHTINAHSSDAAEQLTRACARFDIILDTVGTDETLALAVETASSVPPGSSAGGTTVVALALTESVRLNLSQLVRKQVQLVGSLGASQPETDFPRYTDMYRQTALPIDAYCRTTYRFTEADIRKACDDLAQNRYAGRAVFKF